MKCFFPFAVGAWFMVTACGSSGDLRGGGGGEPTVCNCPSGVFSISVPADRVNDVESVSATGACSHASSSNGDEYYLSEDSVGTCHISVTFKSGAPEFEADVPLTRGTYECEAVCAPTPSSPVVVPEAGEDAGAPAGR